MYGNKPVSAMPSVPRYWWHLVNSVKKNLLLIYLTSFNVVRNCTDE